MDYLFAPPPVVAVPIVGRAERFPLHRIYCVGRNYADHAREMGHDPARELPFFFCKSADAAVVVDGGDVGRFPYPPRTADVHHEMELVVAVGRGGRDVAVADALDHVFGYALGLDMTRRDLQADAKQAGRPWDTAKGFDHAAPLGPIHPAARVGHLRSGAIWLAVNGVERQRADLSQMIWSVAETVAALSTWFELRPGDLIYTGTPAGVGPVVRGDRLRGGIDGLGEFEVDVV